MSQHWTPPGGPDLTYTELVKGWSYRNNRGQPCGTKVFIVENTEQDSAFQFGQYMCGFPKLTNPDTDHPYIERVLPAQFGQFKRKDTGRPFLYATDFNLEILEPYNFDDDIKEGTALRTKVTVTYEPLPYPVIADEDMDQQYGGPDETTLKRYVMYHPNPNAQFLTLPRGAYKWVPAPSTSESSVRVDQTSGKIQAFCQFVYTWYDVPVIPDAIYTHLGSVNSNDDFGGVDGEDGVKPETYYLTGATVKPKRGPGGQRLYDVQWLIKYFDPIQDTPTSESGHNYFLRYTPGSEADPSIEPKYRLITHDGTDGGKRVFKAMDWNKLFTPKGSRFLH